MPDYQCELSGHASLPDTRGLGESVDRNMAFNRGCRHPKLLVVSNVKILQDAIGFNSVKVLFMPGLSSDLTASLSVRVWKQTLKWLAFRDHMISQATNENLPIICVSALLNLSLKRSYPHNNAAFLHYSACVGNHCPVNPCMLAYILLTPLCIPMYYWCL